jgi:peptidoglycan/LPS O-acetylase OafA/YrhL
MDVVAGLGFFRGLYSFFLGTLVYRVYLSKRDLRWKFPSLVEGLCIGIVAAYIGCVDRGPMSMLAPILFAGVVYIFSFEAGGFSRLLLSRPMAALGIWSYSIYLDHILLFQHTMGSIVRVQKFLGSPSPEPEPVISGNMFVMDALVMALIAALIWVSSITYRLIEGPWRQRFYQHADRRLPRSLDAPEEVRPREG